MQVQLINELQGKRILFVEKFTMIPVRLGVVFLASLIFLSRDPTTIEVRAFFLYQTNLYIIANLMFFLVLRRAQHKAWSLRALRVTSIFITITDSLYLSFLIYITGGVLSPLYWAYCGLMIRNAFIFPRIQEQSFINFALCAFYAGAVLANEQEVVVFMREVFYLRIVVLVLVAICCWGINRLIQKRAVIQAENREMLIRKQKIHAIRRMAGDLAHELKNPLAIINAASFYLQQNIVNDNEKIMKELNIIRDEIARADIILSRLMDYSRLESAKLVRIYVNNAIKVILHNMHTEVAYPKVKIEKMFQENLPPLLMDKKHWQQIVSNLLINAFEAVSNKHELGLIEIQTSMEEGNILRIDIADNGVGIEGEDIDKVFKSFYTTKTKGTGLGLSIVKNLVETYDGKIELQSTLEKGSRFTLRFLTTLLKD